MFVRAARSGSAPGEGHRQQAGKRLAVAWLHHNIQQPVVGDHNQGVNILPEGLNAVMCLPGNKSKVWLTVAKVAVQMSLSCLLHLPHPSHKPMYDTGGCTWY